jgi:hypothetical protein
MTLIYERPFRILGHYENHRGIDVVNGYFTDDPNDLSLSPAAGQLVTFPAWAVRDEEGNKLFPISDEVK